MRTISEEDLAIIIDIWYKEWKGSLADKNIPTKFEFIKENLKVKVDKFLTSTGQKK